jgi:hypothetical protein
MTVTRRVRRWRRVEGLRRGDARAAGRVKRRSDDAHSSLAPWPLDAKQQAGWKVFVEATLARLAA